MSIVGDAPYNMQPLNTLIRGRGRGSNKRQEDVRQRDLENMYQRILGEMSVGRFKWSGTEQTRIDRRWLEMQLYLSSLALVVRDDGKCIKVPSRPNRVGTNKVIVLAATPSGYKNVNDNPLSFTAYGPYYQGSFVQARDAVAVWGNAFRVPDTSIVNLYAWKLARLDRTIEINSDATRRTKILAVDEEGQLSAANIQNQIDQGLAVIGVTKNALEELNFETIDLGVDPKSIAELSILRGRIWSECMGLLGVNNSNQDKKERLVESEVSANDDQVDAIRRANLNARQWAAEQMREKFTELKNVTVEYHSGPPVSMPTLDETIGAE